MDRLRALYRLRDKVQAEIEAEELRLTRRERLRPVEPEPPLPDVSNVPASVIREWARLNDIPVPAVGRLPEQVRDAYAQACQRDPVMLFALP